MAAVGTIALPPDVPLRLVGLIPKGLKDSAWGFNPRCRRKKRPALKGRQSRRCESRSQTSLETHDLPRFQGRLMILDLSWVKTPG
jgi:hypothetical protein